MKPVIHLIDDFFQYLQCFYSKLRPLKNLK